LNPEAPRLGRATAAFALSASIAILFNTLLACVKDAVPQLSRFMNALAGHNWTTQGLADVTLFFALGLVLMKTGLPQEVTPRKLISFLTASVVLASIGLASWYALF